MVAVSQYINALREEKKTLIPLFGVQYNEYISSVKGLLLHKREAFALSVWIFAGVFGLFI